MSPQQERHWCKRNELKCVIHQQAICTYGRVYPSKLMFAFVMDRTASGPIDVPCALVEREIARRAKESRSSMMKDRLRLDSLRKTERRYKQP